MKKEINVLAIKVLDKFGMDVERAIEELTNVRDICLIQGQPRLVDKAADAIAYLQDVYY